MNALTISGAVAGLLLASSAAFAGNCASKGGVTAHPGFMGSPYMAGGYGAPAMAYGGYPAKSYGAYQARPATPYGLIKVGHHEGAKPAMGSQDIVDVAVAAGSFNTLAQALKAADLVGTLKGPGPFTVFAPTDEAFAKIPEADLKALLADKEALTKVLTYHVVPGIVTAADVVRLESAKTVQGQSIAIQSKGGVKVNGANVVKTDIMASNGVIHVIDQVILPN